MHAVAEDMEVNRTNLIMLLSQIHKYAELKSKSHDSEEMREIQLMKHPKSVIITIINHLSLRWD